MATPRKLRTFEPVWPHSSRLPEHSRRLSGVLGHLSVMKRTAAEPSRVRQPADAHTGRPRTRERPRPDHLGPGPPRRLRRLHRRPGQRPRGRGDLLRLHVPRLRRDGEGQRRRARPPHAGRHHPHRPASDLVPRPPVPGHPLLRTCRQRLRDRRQRRARQGLGVPYRALRSTARGGQRGVERRPDQGHRDRRRRPGNDRPRRTTGRRPRRTVTPQRAPPQQRHRLGDDAGRLDREPRRIAGAIDRRAGPGQGPRRRPELQHQLGHQLRDRRHVVAGLFARLPQRVPRAHLRTRRHHDRHREPWCRALPALVHGGPWRQRWSSSR